MRQLIPFLFTLSLFSGSVFAQPDPIELTIVGPEGWAVHILHGAPGSPPPVVLQGEEVLYPGHLDCGLAQGHPQCRSLELLLGGEPPGQQSAPGVIIINPGSAASLLDVSVSSYPPPPVVVDGCVVTYRFQDGNCWPGPNSVQVVDASGDIILIDNLDVGSGAPLVLLNDQVLGSTGMDCEQTAPGGWSCLLPGGGSLSWQDLGSGPDGVYTGFEGNVFIDFSVSDSPPPAVYKDGEILNR
jgi:hypothetical protein